MVKTRKHRNVVWKTVLLIILSLPVLSSAKENILDQYISAKLEGKTFHSGLPCGFMFPLQLCQHWDQLEPDQKIALQKPYFDPPQLQDSVFSPSGRFLLHFDRSGGDAVPPVDFSNNGIPDFIDSASAIFDYVWWFEIDSLGFRAPLNTAGKTVDVYHVYFQDLGDEYGVTYPTEEIPGPPNYHRYVSYIILDNTYQNSKYPVQGIEALKVSAAHEFNHAVQLCYRVWEDEGKPCDLYFMEMTSTWLEDVLYEDVNSYLEYLPYFFRQFSNSSFTSAKHLYPYGNSLFLHLLEKEYGSKIGVRIWEKIEQEVSLNAIADVLNSYNSSFLAKLHQYGIWLCYTGEHADPINCFPEGDLYPQLTIDSEDSCLFTTNLSKHKRLPPVSSSLVQIDQIPAGEYQTKVNAGNATGLVSYLTQQGNANTSFFNQTGLIYSGNGGELRVLFTNPYQDSVDIDYNLSLGVEVTGEEMFVFPNPVILSEQGTVSFVNIPQEGEIHIFDGNGEKITRLSVTQSFRPLVWNLTDMFGRPVVSGVYIYLFQGKEISKHGKIAVVR